ncbi:hypothetical protein JCM6882_008213 [Rhodosporidiobolus microsporus]
MSLSSGLTLTDLSDYLAPSQACIKPVTYVPEEEEEKAFVEKGKPAASASAEIVIGEDSEFYERAEDGGRGKKLKKAEITLNDCLACSGCITSAESVLVSLQSHEEVYRVLQEQPDVTPILSISPQSVASLAALYDLSLSETMRGVRRFFKEHLGFRLVFDTTFPRALSLLESRLELLERRSHALSSPSPLPAHLTSSTSSLVSPTKLTPASSPTAPLPILSSACPGWICYAEKTHGDLLPFVSGVKSPQAVGGVLVKGRTVAGRLGLRPDEIYHVAVMPCYDKKLEASRPDFSTSHPSPSPSSSEPISVRDVDLVLTTGEVSKMLTDKSLSLRALARSSAAVEVDGADEKAFFPFSHLCQPARGTSSGGYVHAALSALLAPIAVSSSPASPASPAAPAPTPTPGSLNLSPSDLPYLRLDSRLVRNDDYVEYTLRRLPSPYSPSPSSTPADKEKGTVLAKAAKCYGFRNLQNVVRKLSKDAGISSAAGARSGSAASALRGGAAGGGGKASAAAAAANARRAAKLAAAHGGAAQVEAPAREPEIEFVEVMACPSGCVNGGGQVAPPRESVRSRRRRASWGEGSQPDEGERYVGRVDDEGMPDVVAEVVEAEIKVVAGAGSGAETEGLRAEDRVLSAKEWVQEVEKRYWSSSSSGAASPSSQPDEPTVFGLPLSSLHPSLHPFLLSLPSPAEVEAMEGVLADLLGGGDDAAKEQMEERRRELLRTSYRKVETEEVNGLAVVW